MHSGERNVEVVDVAAEVGKRSKNPHSLLQDLGESQESRQVQVEEPGRGAVPVERCSSTPSPGFCCRRFRPDWALLPLVLALPSSWFPAAQPLLTP